MSDAAKRSHIPDAQLAALTTTKLHGLYLERRMLSNQLLALLRNPEHDVAERLKLEKEIENHDHAYDKLTVYQVEMLDGADRDTTKSP